MITTTDKKRNAAITLILILAAVVCVLVFIFSPDLLIVLHDASAHITVWLDENGNGVHEDNEPFLPDICIYGGYGYEFQDNVGWEGICNRTYHLTDASGTWDEFFPGGTCREIINAINVPEGYYPTTPTIAKGCVAAFGISQEKPPVEIEQEDLAQFLDRENQRAAVIFLVKTGCLLLASLLMAVYFILAITRPITSRIG